MRMTDVKCWQRRVTKMSCLFGVVCCVLAIVHLVRGEGIWITAAIFAAGAFLAWVSGRDLRRSRPRERTD